MQNEGGSVHNIPGFLNAKNALNVAKWQWRWHLQGGCFHWRARDLRDLRTDAERRLWRSTEYELRAAKRRRPKPGSLVNLAKVRIERAKRKAS